MLHAAVMLLMIGSAITAAACCLGAGRLAPGAVPWQARQSAVIMALGMLALCAGDGDARVLLLVAVVGIASAMLGVVGTRGRAHADACFHRALGCVVMAVCALAMLGARFRSPAPVSTGLGHAGHGALVPLSLAAAAGVAALLLLMLGARVRHRGGSGQGDGGGPLAARAVRRGPEPAPPAGAGAGVGAGVLRRRAISGRTLLEAEGIAMAVSLVVMAAMVLMP
ncbi:MAG: hypothetical protein JST33_15515 [Actinobacteria bacterium]|nr:hypothetical protein [Actinomycetota bacterium]